MIHRTAAKSMFWGSVMTLAYMFVLFPLLVIVRAVMRPKPVQAGAIEPPLTVVIAAYNEVSAIATKLDNLLGLDYPCERVTIIVASDGSNDGTNDVVRSYAGRNVRLLELPRVGKAAALRAAVDASADEILVFTDANSIFGKASLRELVAPFADPEIGGVAGNQVYRSSSTPSEAGEQTYWGFDRLLKEFESRAGNTIAATGAVYSIRRAHFRPVPSGVNDDSFVSLGVIRHGRRLVFARQAIAYEPPAPSLDAEYQRKVRVLSRGLRGLAAMSDLLDVRRHGFYSIQLFSHKVLRWLLFVPVGLLALASALLARSGPLYSAAALTQVTFYSAAVAGLLLRRHRLGQSRLLTVPAYFVVANAAAARATWNFVTGRQIDRWQTVRDHQAAVPHSGGSAAAHQAAVGDARSQGAKPGEDRRWVVTPPQAGDGATRVAERVRDVGE